METNVDSIRNTSILPIMSNGAPKSAYELAMERLRKKDAEEGGSALPLKIGRAHV